MHTAKPRAIHASWKEQWPLFALMLPGLISFLLFCYVPFYGILMAFKNYNPLKGVWGSAWIGWANFTYIFALPSFTTALRNTIAIGALKLLFCYPLPIVFALMLNEIRLVRLKRTIQTISYLPHFISWVVAAGIWYRLLSPSSGIVNAILVATGILREPINFVGEPHMFYGLLILTDVWKELGWNAIIYLAAITSINPELYEAARVDGANRLQQVWHITLPGINYAHTNGWKHARYVAGHCHGHFKKQRGTAALFAGQWGFPRAVPRKPAVKIRHAVSWLKRQSHRIY